MAVRTVSVRLEATVAGFNSAMDSARSRVKGVHDEVVGSGKGQQEALDQVGKTAMLAGAAVFAGLGFAAKASMGFEKELSQLAAATGANAATMDQLRDAAIRTGRDTQFSASQAAEAETALAKAGVSVADILGGALTGAVSLAAAGQLELGQAAEIAAGTMAQFGLEGSQVGRVADLLAAGAGKAQGSVQDMGMALKQSGLVAAQTGLSVEETAGALAAFAQNSLLGSDAGTSFKTMLQRLNPQSDEAAALMEELGLSAYDSQGQFVGLAEYSGQLQNALKGMSAEQRNAAMQTLFGSDAVRAAAILYKEGQAGVQGWIDKVDDAGYAAEYAAKANDNLSGDLEELRGSIETGLIGAGSEATGVLRGMTQGLTAAVNAVAGLPGPVMAAGVGFAALAGGVSLFGGAAAVAVGRAAAFRASLLALHIQAATVDRTMRMLSLTMKGGLIAGAVVGVALAVDQLLTATAKSAPAVYDLTGSLIDLGEQGRVSGALLQVVGQDFDNLGSKIRTASSNKLSLFDGAGFREVVTAREELKALDQALAGLVTSGNAEQAADIWQRMQAEAGLTGVSVDELKASMPGYTEATKNAENATRLAADATGEAAGATDMLAESTKAAVDQLQAQADALRAQYDPVFAMQQAVRAHAEAQAALAAAQKESGAASQEAKDADWAAFEATVGLSGAALGLSAALQAGTISTERAKFQLGEWVRQGMLSEEQAERIAMEFGVLTDRAETLSGTPARVEVSAPNAPATQVQIDRLTTNVRQLDRERAMPTVTAEAGAAISTFSTIEQYLASLDGRVATTTVRTRYVSMGTPRQVGVGGGLVEKDGGVLDFYADGGMSEQHVAQIAPAGAWRVWAEPETGGEAYIPLAQAKRGRSAAILNQVADRFGYDLVAAGDGGGGSRMSVDRSVTVGKVVLQGTDATPADLRRELAWLAQ